MAAQIIIPKQTAAVILPVSFRIQGGDKNSIMAEGLDGAEVIPILKSVDGGVTFEAVQQEGAPLVLSVTNNMFAIEAAALYGVTKGDTSNAAGVFITNNTQI